MIYFDAAATTLQKPPQVAEKLHWAAMHCASVGRGGHAPAMLAAEEVFGCRTLAGELFDCKPEQVVFTMNATHALNMAIRTLVKPGDRVVISGFEHNAVFRPLHALGAKIVPAGRSLFDPEDTLHSFEQALAEPAAAVVCTHVSNVFGYILPIERIAALCRARGVPLIVDASQSAGLLPLSLRQLGAAYLAMPGHKALYGPQGTGLLLCGDIPEPLMHGGSGSLSKNPEMPPFLPDRAEAGTHNVCGISALAEGLRFVRKIGTDAALSHEIGLRKHLQAQLSEIKGVRVFSGKEQSGVLSFTVDGMACESVAEALSENEICVRAGFHCAPLAHESAGTWETGTVRVSFSAFNTEAETERFAKALGKCVNSL